MFTSLASAKLDFFDVEISSLSLVLTLPLSMSSVSNFLEMQDDHRRIRRIP